LDGFPKTYEQAKELFAPQEEVDDTDQDAAPVNYNQLIMPGGNIMTAILTIYYCAQQM